MTKQELIEQAAFEAYPENKDYSTVIEKVVDYNLIYRKPYQAGLEKGWQMAVEKTLEYIEANKENVETEDNGIAGWIPDYFIENFRKEMEE